MLSIFLFVLTPFIARMYACFSLGVYPATESLLFWARGFASDTLLGLLAAAVVCMLPLKRRIAFTLWGVWSVLLSMNVAHILVNKSHMNAQFASLAFKREFIVGSVFVLKNAIIIAGVALLTLGLALIMKRFLKFGIHLHYMLTIAAAMALVCAFIPVSFSTQNWIQTNLMEENIKTLLRSSSHIMVGKLPQHLDERFRYTDLSGTPIMPYPQKPQNVIIVILEGVSFSAMNSGHMPYMKKLASENINYKNFFSSQFQTNRGLFALVCGEHPNYFEYESKSDYYGNFGALRPCLPEIISENGYWTTYLQSASLGYMSKDHFSAAAGYNEILGESYFRSPIGRNGWGPDDLSFFRGALEKTTELSKRNSPWMLTLLTAGSHYPYNVPGKKNPSQPEIVSYIDAALEEFIEGLRANGILKNTLVLVTSDESTLMETRSIERNNIPMIAIVPQTKYLMINMNPHTQVDVQTSILDYLKMPLQGSIGRSIFRDYPSGREIVFGNTLEKRAYSLDFSTNILIGCNSETATCESLSRKEVPQGYIEGLVSFIEYNDISSDDAPGELVFSLVNATYSGSGLIMGEKRIILDKGDTIDFRLEMWADAPIHVTLFFLGAENILHTRKKIETGEPFKLDLSHTSTQDDFLINANMFVKSQAGAGYTIKSLEIRKKKAT
jgi:hypothetical protein